jgi:hypothetical protein
MLHGYDWGVPRRTQCKKRARRIVSPSPPSNFILTTFLFRVSIKLFPTRGICVLYNVSKDSRDPDILKSSMSMT